LLYYVDTGLFELLGGVRQPLRVSLGRKKTFRVPPAAIDSYLDDIYYLTAFKIENLHEKFEILLNRTHKIVKLLESEAFFKNRFGLIMSKEEQGIDMDFELYINNNS